MARPTLSLVIPIYNEEEVIPELEQRLHRVLAELEKVVDSWEVLFVEDGSRDRSFELLAAMAEREPRFKVLAFARNFGHQLAITAGLDRAEGDAVVVMDADLQDPPEVIAKMIEKWRAGFDVVYGVRLKRGGETVFKRATAAVFYRVFRSMLGGIDMPLDAGDFRLMSRPAVLALRALREQHRFIRGMVAWIGFKQTAVPYDRSARFAGETKYPFSKMLRFAVDGITSFSIFPLRIATWLGILSGCVAISIGAWTLYEKFFGTGVITGWTTIMLLSAFGFSAQLLMTGILGEYLGRIYEEVKRRPLYISAKELNFSDGSRDAAPRSVPPVPSPRFP
jgi:glycosyltransferase involved in cell wall biosynthesis